MPVFKKNGIHPVEPDLYGFTHWESKYSEFSHGHMVFETSSENLNVYFFRVKAGDGFAFNSEDADPRNAAFRCKKVKAESACMSF